MQHRK